MKIDVTHAPELGEVWVQVTGDDPLPDWPHVRAELDPEYRDPTRYTLKGYDPRTYGEEGRGDYAECWILSAL